MARINYLKLQANNRGRMCACIAHNLRIHDNHSNKDIDPSKSGDNVVLYDLNYNQTVQRLYDRLDEIAVTNTNKRKDRVEMIELTIPYPRDWQQMSRDQQVQWGMDVIDYIKSQYGDDNVIQAVIHYDELHDYLDPSTKQRTSSRPHIHIDVVPERNGKLDSKNMHKREKLQNRNAAIDKLTRDRYGIIWLTGEYKKDTPNRNVEELKAASAKLADAEKAEQIKAEAERAAAEAEKQAEQKIAEMGKKEMEALERATATLRQIDTDIKSTKAEAEATKAEIKADAIAFREQAVEYKKKQKSKIEKEIADEIKAAREQIAGYRQQTAQEQAYFTQAVKRNDFYDRLDRLQAAVKPPAVDRFELKGKKYEGMSLAYDEELDRLEKFASEAAKQNAIVPIAAEMIEAAAEDVHADNRIDSVDEMRTNALAERADDKTERVYDHRDIDDWTHGD